MMCSLQQHYFFIMENVKRSINPITAAFLIESEDVVLHIPLLKNEIRQLKS